MEIHFPHTFYNVRPGENRVKVFSKGGVKNILDVPPNYYSENKSFYAAFNETLTGWDLSKALTTVVELDDGGSGQGPPESAAFTVQLERGETGQDLSGSAGVLVEIDDGFAKFVGNPNTDIEKIKLSPSLARQLGLLPGTNLLTHPNSHQPVEVDRGLPQLIYCYCDIIEEQLVGDTTAPLLRIVNTESKDYSFGRECTQIFNAPIYVPVQKREFSTIEIDLRDGTGSVLPFAHGTSSVLLDFRRIKDN